MTTEQEHKSLTIDELKAKVKTTVRALGGIHELRFVRQSKFTIAVATCMDGATAVGTTICSEVDGYNELYGKLVAASRLQKVAGTVIL